MATATREPWERQPKETDPAWVAFVVYRDQETGERSLREAARTLNKSLTVIGGWSKRWSWVDRVAAWDNEQDRLHRQSLVRRRRLARLRHLRIASQALELVEQQLTAMTARVAAGGDPMKDGDVIRLLTDAARLEREVLGEVQAVDVTSGGKPLPGAVHFGDLTPEEAREKLQQLHAEINRRLTAAEESAGETSEQQGAGDA